MPRFTVPVALAAAVLCLAISRPGVAQEPAVPAVISHQGLLLSADGQPRAGFVTLSFAIYAASEGGRPLWAEEYQLDLVDGYYYVELGRLVPLAAVFDGSPRYLGITVDHADSELEPRRPLASVPHALVAANAVGDITPTSVWVGGRQVIDATGAWVGLPIEGVGGGDGVGYDTPEAVLQALREVDGANSDLRADRLDDFESSDFVLVADLWALVTGADGTNSGLDADRLDGFDSSVFVRTDEQFTERLLAADGSGSTLDADLLDGLDSSAFPRTPREVRDLLVQDDGAGSTVDADRLDGLDSALFMRRDRDETHTANLVVEGALSAGAGLSTDGPVQVGGEAAVCEAATAGSVRYVAAEAQLQLCDGAEWHALALAGEGGGGDPGGGVFGDGSGPETPGRSCLGILEAGLGRGDGPYWIDPNGGAVGDAFRTWCDMSTDGGGWTLLVNVASRDDAIHAWDDLTFWTQNSVEGDASNALTTGFKSRAFAQLEGFSNVMVYAHNAGLVLGYSIYDVLPGLDLRSLSWLMTNTQDEVISGLARARVGTLGCTQNPNREQSEYGDIFIDNAEALVLNRTAGWGSERTNVRLSTALSNGQYGHTYAGLGGAHRHGGWGLDFESAPISPYCSITNGYGSENRYAVGNYRSIGGHSFPYQGGCRGPDEGVVFEWRPADFALYVREAAVDEPDRADGLSPRRAAVTCKELRDDGFSTGTGMYWIDPDGVGGRSPFQAWCDMDTDGGGWTVLLNLGSRDHVIRHYDDNGFWTGAAAGAQFPGDLSRGYRSEAYSRLSNFDEVLVALHNRGVPGTFRWAAYDMLPEHRGLSWLALMTTANNTQITGARVRSHGSAGTTRNPNREQPEHGDIFVDHAEALLLNRTSGWGAQLTHVRISTTLSNGAYGHTYAGLGGRHGHGGWGLYYESAPISPYCSITNGYGDEASHTRGNYAANGEFPYRGSCRGPDEGTVFEWLPHDTLVAVR